MASVCEEEKCPRCGGILISNFNCRTNEEYRLCLRCGAAEKWIIVRKKSRKPVIQRDGKVKWRHIDQRNSNGCACITFKNGEQSYSHFTKPIRWWHVRKFHRILKGPEINPDGCYLTKWDDKTKSVVMIYGYAKTFEEEYKEIIGNE